MILVQPGLPRASGMEDGPDRWAGEGFEIQEIVPSLETDPIGIAAWPDGSGARWLLDALVYLPDTQLWWHYGRRLKPADRTWADRVARAAEMLEETAAWVGLTWGELPGRAAPSQAPGSLGVLLDALPGVRAKDLVQAWRRAPADLSMEPRTTDDRRLSFGPLGELHHGEVEALARFGGYPAPKVVGWVIENHYRPFGLKVKPHSTVERLAGILSRWPSVIQAVGVPDDVALVPGIEDAAAQVLEDAAAQVLGGGSGTDPSVLQQRLLEANEVATA